METCDVLIVGGGPSGSTCAARLRRDGLDVLIVDRRQFPRDKICAGWITPQIVETLGLDLDHYSAAGNVLQEIIGFRTGLIGGPQIENLYDRPVSYGIRRCEFDHYLLERSGARTSQGQGVTKIERSGGDWVVNDRFAAPLLIGAGGHFCPVARRLGARRLNNASVVTAQEIEFEADPSDLSRGRIDATIPELFFCDDLRGYGWCFRKGNFLNIGLGRIDARSLPEHVERFVEFLGESGKVRCAIPRRMHGHAYQLHERVEPRLIDEQVMLIGDAAGLAYAQSGEGIRPAIESGLFAAETIIDADGTYRREQLESYATRLEQRLGRPRRGAATDWLPAGWLRFLAARLLASRRFSRRVVLEKWFLHMDDPAIATGLETGLATPVPEGLHAG